MRIVEITQSAHLILFCGLVMWSAKDTDTLHLTTGWKKLSDGDVESPGPRSGSSVWTDKLGIAWLFGGRSTNGTNNTVTRLRADLWSYDIDAGRWLLRVPEESNNTDPRAALPAPEGRESSAMCGITDGNLVIFGGRTNEVNAADDDAEISPSNWRNHVRATDQMLIWHPKLLPVQFETRICGSEPDVERACPAARYDSLFWCDENFMTVVGGMDTDGRRVIDAWKLDLQRLTWTRLPTPATNCSWTTSDNVTVPNAEMIYAKNDTNRTDTYLEPSDGEGVDQVVASSEESLVLLWSSPISGVHILCDHSVAIERDADEPAIQLWHHGGRGGHDVWTMVGESGSRRDLSTWPGVHLHGDTCSDSTSGNLWLFGGQSRIGGRAYLNNDVWMYNVSAAVWIKPEIPDASEEPRQRYRAAGFCHRDSMFIYGGTSTCGSGGGGDHDVDVVCILNDFWMLDISASSASSRRRPASASTSNAVRQVDDHIGMNTFRRKIQISSDGSSSPSASDGGEPYGSAAIFFGISLSMFAIFGVVLFFRRCVSCPPRDSILLKEAPPVRYTVIPDDTSYTM